MTTKKWYQSKTLKFNVLVVLGAVAQLLTDTQLFSPDIQILAVAGVNVLLRIVTQSKLE